MMESLDGTFAGLLALLLEVELKTALVLGAASVCTSALRRASAASRHFVWTAAVIAVLALPALAVVLPSLPVRAPLQSGLTSRIEPSPEPLPFALASRTELAPAGTTAAAVSTSARTSIAHPSIQQPEDGSGPRTSDVGDVRHIAHVPGGAGLSARVSPAAILVSAWLSGAALLLFWLAMSMGYMHRLRLRTPLLACAALRSAAREVSRELGLRHPPVLLDGGPGAMPLAAGVLRPALLLPSEAVEWPRSHARAVLLHELAHVRRRDILVQLMAEVVQALHWPNPLAWLAARRLVVERERACDDHVLGAGARPSDYAAQLLDLARALRSGAATSRAALAMARPNRLSERIAAVLDDECVRGGVALRTGLTVGLATTLLVLPLAATTPASADVPRPAPAAATAASAPAPTADPAAHVEGMRGAVVEPAVRAATARVQEPCRQRRGGSYSHNVDDDEHRFSWRNGDCRIEGRVEGELQFTEDFTGLAGISTGGIFQVEERDGGVHRSLRIVPDGQGGLAYDWRVNGDRRAFDAEGRRWFSDMLLWLFRELAFAAEERVAYLLRTGGVQGVLAETELIRSDHARAVYLRELMEGATLEPAQLRRVVGLASSMESDHYRAEVLSTIGRRYRLTSELTQDFVAAARAIGSDHYRAQVLRTALTSGQASAADAARVLEAADGMDSDHYRAEVLTSVAGRFDLDPVLWDAYVRVAGGLDSDHYAAQTLIAALERGEPDAAAVRRVVEVVEGIDSDHYRASVLVALPVAHLSDAGVQSAFVRAAGTMDSDHYKSEVLQKIAAQPDLAPEVVALVLTTSRTIRSDHDRAQVLTRTAGTHRIEGPLLDAFMRAADEIRSEHYHGQVMSALRGRGGGR